MQEFTDTPLPFTRVRGNDLQEAAIDTPPGHPPLSGALVYGFRSIQNLVRRMKRGQCPYDFVEVMACPSGCLNGGGQIAVGGGQGAIAQHVEQLDALYHERGDVRLEWPWEDDEARALAAAAAAAGWGEGLFGAQFVVREKTVQAAVLDW